MNDDGLSISLPYPEAATMALARQASRDSALDALYCPHYGLARTVQRVSSRLGYSRLAGRLGRSEENITEMQALGRVESQVRFGVKLMRSQWLARRWMHHWAVRFDALVADQITSRSWGGCHIGLPGASLQSFRANATHNGWNVLQAVNSHPVAHNALLALHYPSAGIHHELVPEMMRERQLIEFSMASAVFVPSRATARQMIECGVDENRIRVIPYDFHTSTVPPTRVRPLERRASKRPLVVFVGQVGYIKGIPHLLEAARGLAVDIHLYGPIVSRSVLQSLPTNIEYKGIADRRELSIIYQSADALVLPSIMDTFAFVVVEAVSLGLPVLLSDSVGARELLTAEDCRTFPAGSVETLRQELSCVKVLPYASRVDRIERVLQARAASSASHDGSYGCRALRALSPEASQR